MIVPFNTSVWLYRWPVDFRKQIDGLSVLVADTLARNPLSGELFVFRNRSGDKVKILYWSQDGFWLLYKRIERGRLVFPAMSEGQMELSLEQLQWLLSGLDIERQPRRSAVQAEHFF